MKIENIIDDIKADIIDLRDKLEERFRNENPHLNFCISLPGIEDLTTIKSIALSIEEENTIFYSILDIHTHNGNRVFETPLQKNIGNQPQADSSRNPFQDTFIDLLRDIIKKNKIKGKTPAKNNHQLAM